MKALVIPFTESLDETFQKVLPDEIAALFGVTEYPRGDPYPHVLDLNFAQAFYPVMATRECLLLSNAFIYPLDQLLPDQVALLRERGALEMEAEEKDGEVWDHETYNDVIEPFSSGYRYVFSAVWDDPDPAIANMSYVKYWFARLP